MFNEEFFPTPDDVIRKMIHGINWNGRVQILEPSAGKGNILDYIADRKNIRKEHCYCMESNPELSMILKSKKYHYIGADFLQYSGSFDFDYILMNPPFSNGVDHVLKAWDIITDGTVIAVLPLSNISNTFSEKRKLLTRLIEDFGEVENIGKAFYNAERKTGVECVIIRLTKKVENKYNFNFDSSSFNKGFDKLENEYKDNLPATNDLIQSIVDQYRAAESLLVESYNAQKKFEFYTKSVFAESYTEDGERDKDKSSLNERIRKLKSTFWNYILGKIKLGEFMPSGFRKKFQTFIEEQGNILFDKPNIVSVFDMFFLNKDQIISDCINEVFFELIKYHYQTRYYSEGWKSNSDYMINSHIIIPNGVKFEWGRFDYRYDRVDLFNDLDIIISWLTGIKLQKGEAQYCSHYIYNGINESIYTKLRGCKTNPGDFDSLFFRVRCFKKGTVHLYWKDDKHRDALNRAVAENKNWIPKGR